MIRPLQDPSKMDLSSDSDPGRKNDLDAAKFPLSKSDLDPAKFPLLKSDLDPVKIRSDPVSNKNWVVFMRKMCTLLKKMF